MCCRAWGSISIRSRRASRTASRKPGSDSCSRPIITPRCALSARTSVELGIRTIFNLIGPPVQSGARTPSLLGVYHPKWLMPFAQTLQNLDSETIWAVYGEGGLDEISTLGESRVVELKDGEIKQFVITPEEVGIKRASMAQIRGGSGDHNAKALTAPSRRRERPLSRHRADECSRRLRRRRQGRHLCRWHRARRRDHRQRKSPQHPQDPRRHFKHRVG